jgi:IS5 family transposase
MISLLYLKNSFNLSDEEVCERWSESPLWQFFSGLDYYEHRLPCDATQVGRFRHDIGEDGMELLLKATIDTAVTTGAVKPEALERVTVDTTVQEKAIAHPVDSRLLEIARHKVVAAAKRAGIREIILPWQNEKDLKEVPERHRKGMKFHPVKYFDEVVKIALGK